MNMGNAVGIDPAFAQYSDLLYQSAFAVYALAFILLLTAFATTVKPTSPISVAVGGQQPATETGTQVDAVESPPRTVAERLENIAGSLLVAGVGLHLLSIILRGLATHRYPLGNMYEFISMACVTAMAVGLVFTRGKAMPAVWALQIIPVLILMYLAGTVLYTNPSPVMPALQTYWLPVHVTIICTGSGIFLVSGIASLLYLVPRKPDSTSSAIAARFDRWLPPVEVLDRLAYRTAIIGFPLFATGVTIGAIWAEAAWGRFWGWDPKETTAFITLVIYAGYLHARATAGWKTEKAAWVNVAGTVSMLFNLFVINIVVAGLHSYAGLN